MAASRRLAWWLAVAVGGSVGTLVRYEATSAHPLTTGRFPWSVFVVNVVGCVVAGAATAFVHARPAAPTWIRPLVVIGVCGGLTTFSTWMVTDVLLVRDDAAGLAVLDVAVSLVAGLLAVWIAYRGTTRALGAPRGAVLDVREAD